MAKYLSVYLPIHFNASQNTILAYRDVFKLLLRFVETELKIAPEKITLDMLDYNFVMRFQDWLRSQNSSHSTINHRLATIRAFFRYVKRERPERLLQCQEILEIELHQSKKATVNYISVDGIKAIMEQPDSADKYGLRDLALLGLMYESGARVSEIVSLKPCDLRLTTSPIVTLFGKGSKQRHCPIPKNVADNLKVYLSAWGLDKPEKSDSPLFFNHQGNKIGRAGISYVINKYANKARKIMPSEIPPTISPHVIRHSKAMHLLQAGVNLIYIRDWLGHEHTKTTEIYARADSEMKRNALQKAASAVIPQIAGNSWLNDGSMMCWLNSLGK
jgi:site-specific recombinase XerD